MTGATSDRPTVTAVRAVLCALRIAFVPVIAAALLAPRAALADPVKADVSVTTANGYARIVFNFNEDVDSEVRQSNGVLVITFKRPVDFPVDRISNNGEYTSAARRDPDGKGVRVALTRKVTVNSMVAGERLFVDLLPDTWTGPPPSLPQEVVEDLARRTREAERKARAQQVLAEQRAQIANRVRVSNQPTFSRYVFELPELLSVSTDRGKEKLVLTFDAMLKFDLADAKASQPPMVESIETVPSEHSTAVTLNFIGKVDIRTFREDNNYIVDVSPVADAKKAHEDEDAPAGNAPAEKAEAKPSVEGQPPGFAETILKGAEPPPATASPDPKAVPDAQTMPPAEEKAEAPSDAPRDPKAPVKVTLKRQADNLKLGFAFGAATPAAAYMRGDMFMLIFDTAAPIDVSALQGHPLIVAVTSESRSDYQIVRIAFVRPRLVNLTLDDYTWTVNATDAVADTTLPLNVERNSASEMRAAVQIPFEDPRQVRRIEDTDGGGTLIVVTALGPPRGLLKAQEFVEFRALASAQGVVIEPIADDLNVELASDRVMIGRPTGLILSQSGPGARRAGLLRPMMFEAQQWATDRDSDFTKRFIQLLDVAAEAPEATRTAVRLNMARFYFARSMYVEAKGVLDVVIADNHPTGEDTMPLVMHAVANAMIERSDDALKDLGNPIVGNQNDAALWRAFAAAKLGRWAEARDGFQKTEVAVGMLPVELQREILIEQVRAAIEVRDFAAASTKYNEFESLRASIETIPMLAVLMGRIHEGLGHNGDALSTYRAAADSPDRAVSAQGRLREIALRYQVGDLKRADVITELESLTSIWRGDDTEIEALHLLSRLYTEEGRYRDAFNVMQVALKSHANSDMTRRIQDEAAATFDALFLGGKGDGMTVIDALSLFYDFRELTPIGRRGDEMIRRLAERLVSIDLLDQAAELLQHQVDHRLQGAARAQVATRLAVIYLMNHKPDRALAVLKATRLSELPNELRNQRLLIEARALSDIGRPGVALEVVQYVMGSEAIRLRADILWAAKRFSESAEQIELLYGDRFKDWQPLDDVERRDILRAALGFALSNDQIGLGRFKDKFAAGMMRGPDRRAFEIVVNPLAAKGDEFAAIARSIAAVDTLDQFLKDMRTRYPDTTTPPMAPTASPDKNTPSTAPRAERPDFTPTGTISRPPGRAKPPAPRMPDKKPFMPAVSGR